MADLISAEYEQDCCHSILNEMKIGDDEVSWRVEYYKTLVTSHALTVLPLRHPR